MRSVPILAPALILLAMALPAHAGELRFFDDAALRAVHFVDADEGWAVGDEGVVWHTIDGGRNWERQPTGVRASLRSVHFLPNNPYSGWIAGREELPQGGSAGVLLCTQDGGVHWKRALLNALPGLNVVRFVDERTGFLAGDGADHLPSGLFATNDGGKSWQPVPGPRSPSWLAGDFGTGTTGALAGAWNRLASLRRDHLALADVDSLGGRALRGLKLLDGGAGVAVGQGGLVLLSKDGGTSWRYADLGLPPDVLADWDFDAVHAIGSKIWVVGRPGSAILHSRDLGRTWEVLQTRQPLPLHGVTFRDALHGWAVGELGLILGTADGGKTWQVQHRAGQRAAVVRLHARPDGVPLDTIALLGGQEGYFTTALRITGSDCATAAPGRSTEPLRFAAALRQAGAVSGEILWQFPIPSHLAHATRQELLASWDQLHGGKAADQLLRQLVLTLRIWRPDVVLTDNPEHTSAPSPTDALLAEATKEAFRQAADPRAFPEQLGYLGLETWKPSKLYARWEGRTAPHLSLDTTDVEATPRLGASAQEFAQEPAVLLAEGAVSLPASRGYRLLATTISGAEGHQHLMDGLDLPPGGVARRPISGPGALSVEEVKANRQAVALKAILEAPPSALTEPDRLLGQLGFMLADLPDDRAGRAAHAVASHFARHGQWSLAREAFLLMVERYPAHPLTADAYRWLIRHNSSSEARRRHELGQFLILKEEEAGVPKTTGVPVPVSGASGKPTPTVPEFTTQTRQQTMSGEPIQTASVSELVNVTRMNADRTLAEKAAARQWYRGALNFEAKLAALGPLFANDPGIQFPLQAAHRRLGEVEAAQKWYRQFATRQPNGPWRNSALAELWLANRAGPAPRPLAACRYTDTRPLLDGKLDEACWQGPPLNAQGVGGETLKDIPLLQNAAGDTLKDYPTEVRLAYDQEYLYVAVRCFHPDGQQIPLVKGRTHDADLRAFDRVSILLDLDRDYATCFHLQIDQRGCVAEDCWGDRSWDPRWFVAMHSEARCWTAEVAIPLAALTGDPVAPGSAWAFNAVRVLPGRGVQAWSLPAEVPEEMLRPEGMGLLLFTQNRQQ